MTPIAGPACAIIVAAGNSERMGGTNKMFAQLVGRPLIVWTLGAFNACDSIDHIIVVASSSTIDRLSDLIVEWRFDRKVRAVVAGGTSRQESVRAAQRNGLNASPDAAIVAIHDGARPLVTPELIDRGIALARETGAALCAIPARDTIKEVSGDPPVVTATPERAAMWLAQTPQCFERGLIIRAHEQATDEATDDAALVEALGHKVTVYEGSPSNIKITTPEDLIIAEALLRKRFEEL